MTGQLPDSPAAIFAQLLIDLGLATDPSLGQAWPVRATGEIDAPDDLITVYDVVGRQDGRSQVEGFRFEHYGVQVRVRSSLPATGFAKTQAIAVMLDEGVDNATVTVDGTAGTTSYSVPSVSRTGQVNSLGRGVPASKRSLFTVNFVAPIILLSDPVLATGYFPTWYF